MSLDTRLTALVNDRPQLERQPSRFLAWMAIFVVLAASSIQVAHVCSHDGAFGPQSASSQHAITTSPAAFCQICLGAQPATSSAPALAQAPALVVTMASAAVAAQFYPNDRFFSLYIRPPPAN